MAFKGLGPEMSYPSSMPVPQVSIVMPCFNECDRIEKTVLEWLTTMHENKISCELLLINDGSLDGTGRVLDKLRKDLKDIRVIHQLNQGHGKAVRRGYELSRGEWVLQVDSNGCYEPSDFLLMWETRHSADLLIASRTHRIDSALKRLLAKCMKKMIHAVFKVEVQDPDASFRLFRRERAMPFIKQLDKSVDSVNLAMTVLMKKENPFCVAEVRIPFRLRPVGRGRTPIKQILSNALHAASEMMRIKVTFQPIQQSPA